MIGILAEKIFLKSNWWPPYCNYFKKQNFKIVPYLIIIMELFGNVFFNFALKPEIINYLKILNLNLKL